MVRVFLCHPGVSLNHRTGRCRTLLDEARRRLPAAARWRSCVRTTLSRIPCCRAKCWTFPSVPCLAPAAKTTTVPTVVFPLRTQWWTFPLFGEVAKGGSGATAPPAPLRVTKMFSHCSRRLQRCNPWPHVANRHIVSRSPHSHYDVILIVTSFATELATPTVTDVRTY